MKAYKFWYRWSELEGGYYGAVGVDWCYSVMLVARNLTEAKEMFYKSVEQSECYIAVDAKLYFREVEINEPVILSAYVEKEYSRTSKKKILENHPNWIVLV